MATFDSASELKSLDDLRAREASQLAQLMASRYGLSYVDLSHTSINSQTVKIIPEELARKATMVIFNDENKKLSVAVQSPKNPELPAIISDLERQGYHVEIFISSEFEIAKAWEIYKEVSYAHAEEAGVISISDATMQKYVSMIKTIADVRGFIDESVAKSDTHSLSTAVEIMMGGAVATGVSDVHIEPEKEVVHVRYRLDGVLQNVAEFSNANYHKVLSRIKLLAGVKLNVTREAQDGRFTIKIQGIDVEVRTSIIPAAYAESVVMRILNPKSISVPMEELGMDEHLLAIMNEQIMKPNGLILTTGPTGSGKTTTLYAILKKLRSPQTKIITIEDPIEYHLEGISQTQVDHEKGYDFHHGLRAAVRQDPDVILVGEIRDEE
ncbi:MAG TPA: ATPase, T2SS/T4P/T4SS family, partial [Candidatus Paceibacterota bacterium]|nr:ATPase, T2SS/T4P/T4SS family [Candidatus Paceibacterota bacterium]